MKRGYLLASAFDGRGQALQRAWALLAALALLASMLFVGAANPTSVLGAPGSTVDRFSVVITGTPTAGSSFDVTVTARDSRGRVVPSYSGGATLDGSAFDPSPNGTPAAPSTLGSWENGVSMTTVTPKKSQAGAILRVRDLSLGVTSFSDTFSVRPGTPTSIAFADVGNDFNGQPVDAEFDTAITSSLITDDPVKVIALDEFGNRVGGVAVTMSSSPNNLDGTKSATTDSTGDFGTSPYGEAEFASLSITEYGEYTLNAAAGSLSATSASFEIVADLQKCTGSSCKSTGRSVGANLQITYSSLTGVTSFDDVTLTTSFIGAATDAGCTGSAAAFGQLTEVRVQGSGVTRSRPAFKFAMIVPKVTLQALNLTSRAADSFNMCLGATRLDGGSGGWVGRETIGGPLVTLGDPDNDGVYWGFVADCTTPGIEGSPCISLKTKNAGQLQAELGMTKSEFRDLGFVSSDLGVVVRKPYPWDGKGGLF